MQKTLNKSLIFFGILYGALALLASISSRQDYPLVYAKLIWYAVISVIGFCIYRTGAISKYRSMLFILTAFLFFLEFKLFRFLSFADIPSPYCHIAEAPTLLNFIHSQYLAVVSGQWRVWGVLTLGFLWLLIIFTIGTGICSWVCFFGGIDEACSKIAKKPLLKLNIPRPWRDFPIAFLVFLLIVSFLQMSPVFCIWFCPFKMTEAFWSSYHNVRMLQAALFWSVLVLAVIILPILTKKRIFCSLVCPFGALASICGVSRPYKVTIDSQRCIKCGRCLDECPMLAVDKSDKSEYGISQFCNICGKCIDICPVDAISISARQSGKQVDVTGVFVFLALLLTGALSGSFAGLVILQLAGLR